MKKKKIVLQLFVCGYCGTEYESEEDAVNCEEFHSSVKKMAKPAESDFAPFNKKDASPYPGAVMIEMEDGTLQKYRFEKTADGDKARAEYLKAREERKNKAETESSAESDLKDDKAEESATDALSKGDAPEEAAMDAAAETRDKAKADGETREEEREEPHADEAKKKNIEQQRDSERYEYIRELL